MKNVIFFLTLFSLFGCGTGNKYLYLYSLKNEQSTSFSDQNIKVDFVFSDKMINFSLKNNSNVPLKISWDESSLVLNGITEKLIHTGTKMIDSEKSQLPTIVPPLATVMEGVMPSSNIVYQDQVRDRNSGMVLIKGGWVQKDLLPTIDYKNKQLREEIFQNKGKVIGLFLGVYVNNELKNYYFEFEVKDVLKV